MLAFFCVRSVFARLMKNPVVCCLRWDSGRLRSLRTIRRRCPGRADFDGALRIVFAVPLDISVGLWYTVIGWQRSKARFGRCGQGVGIVWRMNCLRNTILIFSFLADTPPCYFGRTPLFKLVAFFFCSPGIRTRFSRVFCREAARAIGHILDGAGFFI